MAAFAVGAQLATASFIIHYLGTQAGKPKSWIKALYELRIRPERPDRTGRSARCRFSLNWIEGAKGLFVPNGRPSPMHSQIRAFLSGLRAAVKLNQRSRCLS
jgi:hypothetical protein